MNNVQRFPTKIKALDPVQQDSPRVLPPAPYPPDTEVGRFSVQMPHGEIESSRGWLLAPADVKPLILMLFYRAWKLKPAGALPADDELIAAILGIEVRRLQPIRRFLLDGWVPHEDGRLYHPILVHQVEKMLEGRAGGAERQRRWRESRKKRQAQLQTDAVVAESLAPSQEPDTATWQDDAADDVADAPKPKRTRQSTKGAGDSADDDTGPPPSLPKLTRQHSEVIDIYHDLCPELPRVCKSRWVGSGRERELARRIKENPEEHSNPLFWRAFFAAVRKNPHWMGLSRPRDGGVPWRADLGWLLKRASFDRVIELLPQADEHDNLSGGRS